MNSAMAGRERGASDAQHCVGRSRGVDEVRCGRGGAKPSWKVARADVGYYAGGIAWPPPHRRCFHCGRAPPRSAIRRQALQGRAAREGWEDAGENRSGPWRWRTKGTGKKASDIYREEKA